MLIVLFSCAPRAAGAQAQRPDALGEKNVLILHAFEAGLPVFEKTHEGFDRTFGSSGVSLRNQFFEYLDLARNPGPEYKKRLAELMRLRYGHRKIDAIVTFYPEALQFVINEGRTIFSDPPIVALFLPPDFQTSGTRHHIIQLSAVYDLTGTLEAALRLAPGATRVYLVFGAYGNDRKLEERARYEFKKWEDRLEFRYLGDLPLEKILATVADAPGGSIILFGTFTADVTGANYTSREVAQRLSRVARGPVFGLHDAMLGAGIVGGSLVSFEDIGAQAGQLVLKILEGGNVREGTPTFLAARHIPMFDWRELKRWNLSVDAVPPGSIVINREYTFWEWYRTAAIIALFVFVLQGLLIVGLVVSQAQRHRAERQLAQQLRLETLLADLSARFVHLPASQVESEIHTAQRRVCEILDLDRSTLLQVPQDEPGTMRLTHSYEPSGTRPAPARFDARDVFPWSLQMVMRGETLILSTLAALPPDAARDRESFHAYGTISTVVIPLVAEGTVMGALSFATTRAEREWPEGVVKGFRMVAEVFANALARKRADQALRESQARLTLAAASADARLWEIDAKTERVWTTDEGRAFFGLTANDVLTLDRMATFIHPDDRDSWRQGIRQALESGHAMHAEFRVVRPDGSVRWFVAQGRPHIGAVGEPVRLLGVSIDVTDRRQTEERLRTSEVVSGGILSSLPGSMVVVDRSGAILRASDSWNAFARGDGALDPTVVAITEGPLDARQPNVEKAGPATKDVLNGIKTVLAGMQTEFRIEYAYPTRTEERWASVSVLPLLRPEGGAVIYHQDITAQQRSRLETERLRRELTHVGRVTMMGEMAAALAHELNQPLTAILSNAHAGERYLTHAAPPLGEVREILRDVAGDARRAGEVIQRLRSLLRKDDTKYVALDMNQVVGEVAVLTNPEAILRDLTVELDLAPDLRPVYGDRVQLQQVSLNLVLNGMEAMGSGEDGRRILIRTLPAEGAVCVAIRDQGSGIPADDLSRIFEAFYTTKSNGMGMGLAISRSIVEAHGGRIWAENNPDRGATFAFTIPACPPESSPA